MVHNLRESYFSERPPPPSLSSWVFTMQWHFLDCPKLPCTLLKCLWHPRERKKRLRAFHFIYIYSSSINQAKLRFFLLSTSLSLFYFITLSLSIYDAFRYRVGFPLFFVYDVSVTRAGKKASSSLMVSWLTQLTQITFSPKYT